MFVDSAVYAKKHRLILEAIVQIPIGSIYGMVYLPTFNIKKRNNNSTIHVCFKNIPQKKH